MTSPDVRIFSPGDVSSTSSSSDASSEDITSPSYSSVTSRSTSPLSPLESGPETEEEFAAEDQEGSSFPILRDI